MAIVNAMRDLPMEENSELGASEEPPARSWHTRTSSVRHARGSEDAFESYLRDIRGFSLLTHAEELDLARRVAAGDALARRRLMSQIYDLSSLSHVNTAVQRCLF